jgi:hypothetical protein
MRFGEKNLKIIYSILSLFAPICVSASGPAIPLPRGLVAQVFHIENEEVRFHVLQGRQPILLTEKCRKTEGTLDCSAHRALQGSHLRDLTPAQLASGDLGAQLCSRSGGVVVTGVDLDHNSGGFCRFDDQSMVDLASLAATAHRNQATP